MTELFNAMDYLVERHLRDGNGARTAVVTRARTLTYEQLAAEVRAVAAGLRALGVRPEERVLLCMTDDVEQFAAILAAMSLGSVAVPCSAMLTPSELGGLMADSRCRIVLASAEYGAVVRSAVAHAPEVRHLVVTGDEPGSVPGAVPAHTWKQLLDTGRDQPVEPYPTWPDSPALWLYTSGTTGKPKAAIHRHADIRTVAETYGRHILGVAPGDRCLSVAKLYFAYGIGNSMFLPLAAGATVLLEDARPSPQVFARRAADDGATLLFGTPSFWGPLLASSVSDDAFASVRQAASAGEALPTRMYHEVLKRFGVEILDGLGSTELLHIFLSNRPGEVHPGSSGHPVPGYRTVLRDSEGAVVEGEGTAGELYVSGESAALGYWCRAQATRQVFLGDWVRTGDTYVRNPDGSYTCQGRSNDLLKVGGIWVSPGEVEDTLLGHPDIAEVALVGVPDADGLDRPIACVVLKPGGCLDADTLIGWCRRRMAAFKRPQGVVTLPELPRTSTGKIRRDLLREMAKDTVSASPASRRGPRAVRDGEP